MEEKYYVASDSNYCLTKIFFNPIDAFVSGFPYLDTFDEAGGYIRSYILVNDEYLIIHDS